MFHMIYAAVVQKVCVINGTVISNHDISKIKKLYKMLESLHMPVLDGKEPERYFYRKVFLSQMKKLIAGEPFKISEEELRQYIDFQLMQLNIPKEQLDTILKEYGISLKDFEEYFSDTLQWFRYVAMNYSGLARPSEKAVTDFMKQINMQIQDAPSTFLNGYIVQVRKSQESLVDELNINAMIKAQNKDEFLKAANNYEKQTLTQVPLEAVNHPVIKNALEQAYKTKKAVVCPVEDNLSLVIYVSDVKIVKRTINKEQAAQMLSNQIITEKCSSSAIRQISKKLKIKHG